MSSSPTHPCGRSTPLRRRIGPNVDPLEVGYDYDNQPATVSNGNFSRITGLVYPDGEVTYIYSPLGSEDPMDDPNSRISRPLWLGVGTGYVDYSYVGLDMFAIVSYTEPWLQLDRTASHNGHRQFSGYIGDSATDNPGIYPGFDRFGRVARQAWVDGEFTVNSHSTTVPSIPPVVEQVYGYDHNSNRTAAYDGRPGSDNWPHSFEYDYDGLDRLAEAKRGPWDSQASTPGVTSPGTGSQRWDLDLLGNWAEFDTNYQSGSYQDAEPREHNGVNELTFRDHPSGLDLDLTYDDNGNMATQEVPGQLGGGATTVSYVHDAWNRLVSVTYGSTVRAEYEYNALNWRTVKRANTNSAGPLDQQRLMYYDANWQLVEERVDDDLDGTIDRKVQYVWGTRYIDDIVLHRQADGEKVATTTRTTT